MAQETDILRQQLEYRKRLMDKINEIHSADSLTTILITIKDSIVPLFKAERITIYLTDSQRNHLVSKVKTGPEVQQIVVPISDTSLSGYCAITGTVINVKNAYDAHELRMIGSNLKFDDSWDRKTGFRTRQVLCMPMKFRKALIGVIQIINKSDNTPFSDTDIRYASELATSLAIAVHNICRLSATTRTVRQKARYHYLLNRNLVDETTLEKASAHPETATIGTDAVLTREFGVSREDMAKNLSLYFGTEFIACYDPAAPPLEEGLLKRVKPERLVKELWVPYRIENGILHVIMEDPTDLGRQDTIKFVYPEYKRISHIGAFRDDIRSYINLFYRYRGAAGTGSSINELLSRLDTDDEPEVESESHKISEQDSVIVQLVNKIIMDAVHNRVSDIHIEPFPGREDVRVRMRIDGRCKVYQRIPYKYKYALPSRIKIMSGLDISERRRPQDGKIDFRKFGPLDVELRVATVPTAGQLEDVVMRVLASGEALPFDKLGLTQRNARVLETCIHQPHGLILVVGPTGSGKTTTLHSAIAVINTPETKIWTAEDPVEITQRGLRQVQVHPRIGFTFAAALRSFLRADPDVIMVGEMRDRETAEIGVEASLTGHLVFSTLHTNSAPETITRLLDMDLDPFGFSDAILCILAQRLARRLCTACRQEYVPDRVELEELILEYGIKDFGKTGLDPAGIRLHRATGCATCGGTGYKGRLGLHELLEGTEAMKTLVKRRADIEVVRRQAVTDGMTTLKQDGILKCLQGLTDMREVRRVCIK